MRESNSTTYPYFKGKKKKTVHNAAVFEHNWETYIAPKHLRNCAWNIEEEQQQKQEIKIIRI